MSAYFTIGHSTHAIGEFISILLPENIEMVVDVRTIPARALTRSLTLRRCP